MMYYVFNYVLPSESKALSPDKKGKKMTFERIEVSNPIRFTWENVIFEIKEQGFPPSFSSHTFSKG